VKKSVKRNVKRNVKNGVKKHVKNSVGERVAGALSFTFYSAHHRDVPVRTNEHGGG